MSFLFDYDAVYFQDTLSSKPVIYIYDDVYIDDIFDLWFERGLLRASLNEEVMFDLGFGEYTYFDLIEFVHMLEKRIEK